MCYAWFFFLVPLDKDKIHKKYVNKYLKTSKKTNLALQIIKTILKVREIVISKDFNYNSKGNFPIYHKVKVSNKLKHFI